MKARPTFPKSLSKSWQGEDTEGETELSALKFVIKELWHWHQDVDDPDPCPFDLDDDATYREF